MLLVRGRHQLVPVLDHVGQLVAVERFREVHVTDIHVTNIVERSTSSTRSACTFSCSACSTGRRGRTCSVAAGVGVGLCPGIGFVEDVRCHGLLRRVQQPRLRQLSSTLRGRIVLLLVVAVVVHGLGFQHNKGKGGQG